MSDSLPNLAPMRLGEIVLQTARFDELRRWYILVLGLGPSLEHAVNREPSDQLKQTVTRMCFFRMHTDHPYQDVVALFEVPGKRAGPSGDSGLHHIQLRNASLAMLGKRYWKLRHEGLVPHRAMDHGPSTSLYYLDPDQNLVEIAASNFNTLEETLACLASQEYKRNPAGRAIEPELVFSHERAH